VKTLAHGQQEIGRYHVTWNGTDDQGTVAKAGLYFVRLDVGGVRQSRLLSVIR
jgi:flagellar hook assembly protein FlgD